MDSVDLAHSLASALADRGSRVMFGMPGGGNNLDLIGVAEEHYGFRFVLAHGETNAACMASAYAEITGEPTAVVVTRGPGAMSAVNGVAQALLDRQPLVAITDAVPAQDDGRISHQRVDQVSVFSAVTNWSGRVGGADSDRTISAVLDLALGPRPGPVHLDFDPSPDGPPADVPTVKPAEMDPADVATALSEQLAAARRLVVIVGMGARRHVEAVRDMVEYSGAIVLQTYRGKGVVPESWPHVAGLFTGATMEAPILEEADLVLMVGVDSVELIPGPWPYPAPVVSVSDWEDDYSYFPVSRGVVGPLRELLPKMALPRDTLWENGRANQHRDDSIAALGSTTNAPGQGIHPVDLARLVRAVAPSGSIVTVDAGAHMLAVMPVWMAGSPDEVLISSGLATMGYALPAAVGAALARPGRRVFCCVGDGGLGMTLAELETIVRLQLPVTVVVFNDSSLSLIKLKQKATENGGPGAVSYGPVDFATMARGVGLAARRAEHLSDVRRAISESTSGPLLIDVRVDPHGYEQVLRATRFSRRP